MNTDDKDIRKFDASIDSKNDAIDERNRLRAGFDNMDAKVIAGLEDSELATFQSGYAPQSPQFIRAEHEWQRRLLARQLRSDRLAIWVGLASVVLGWILGKL